MKNINMSLIPTQKKKKNLWQYILRYSKENITRFDSLSFLNLQVSLYGYSRQQAKIHALA